MQANTAKQPPIINRRLRALLVLRGIDVNELARRAEISYQHLYQQLRGERTLSARTQRVVQEAVGKDGWDFATGRRSDMKDPL